MFSLVASGPRVEETGLPTTPLKSDKGCFTTSSYAGAENGKQSCTFCDCNDIGNCGDVHSVIEMILAMCITIYSKIGKVWTP